MLTTTVFPLSIENTLPRSCEFAVAAQDAFVYNLGTLALSRDNPSSTLSFCTAHLVLNTLRFVFGLTV